MIIGATTVGGRKDLSVGYLPAQDGPINLAVGTGRVLSGGHCFPILRTLHDNLRSLSVLRIYLYGSSTNFPFVEVLPHGAQNTRFSCYLCVAGSEALQHLGPSVAQGEWLAGVCERH